MPIIRLDQVSKYYRWEDRPRPAASEISLEIHQGEFVFVVGSSGAGKSTLLKLITGELRPDAGTVYLDGRNLRRVPPWRQTQIALTFGRVWQEPRLMRKRTIGENLTAIARLDRGRMFPPTHKLDARVSKVLGLVGMPGIEAKYPADFSLGELRRVELARALINSPPILVLDEITANLDDDNIWDMFHLLQHLNHLGTTVIMATHASQYVNIMRRRVVTLVDGRIFGDVKRGRYGDIV